MSSDFLCVCIYVSCSSILYLLEVKLYAVLVNLLYLYIISCHRAEFIDRHLKQ